MKRIIAFFALAIMFTFSFSAFAVTCPDGITGFGNGNLMMKVTSHVILPVTLAHERMLSSTDSLEYLSENNELRPTTDGLLSYSDQSITPAAGGLRAGCINAKA